MKFNVDFVAFLLCKGTFLTVQIQLVSNSLSLIIIEHKLEKNIKLVKYYGLGSLHYVKWSVQQKQNKTKNLKKRKKKYKKYIKWYRYI